MSENLLKSIISKTNFSQYSLIPEIFWSDTNPAVLFSSQLKKVEDKIVKISDNRKVKLEKYSFLKENLDESLKNALKQVIKSGSFSTDVDFFPKGIFSIFKRRRPEKIISQLSECSWVLLSPEILKELKNYFSEDPYQDGFFVGKIGELDVYLDSTISNQIFFGNKESTEIFFNKNFTETEKSIEIELSIYNKSVRKLIVR